MAKDELTTGLFFGGGFGVLVSYMFLISGGYMPNIGNVFTQNTWRLWSISVILTVAAIVGLYAHFSFSERMEGWARDLFIVSTCVFFSFAMLWAYATFRVTHGGGEMYMEKVALAAIAAASIGIFTSTVDQTKNALVIVAAAFIVFHYVVMNGVVWGMHATKQKISNKRSLIRNR